MAESLFDENTPFQIMYKDALARNLRNRTETPRDLLSAGWHDMASYSQLGFC